MESLVATGIDIMQVVVDKVKECYDSELDTMEVEMHFANGVDCELTKDQGKCPVCRLFDEDGDELRLPYTQKFIGCTANAVIGKMKKGISRK